jgi:hypothetical protein
MLPYGWSDRYFLPFYLTQPLWPSTRETQKEVQEEEGPISGMQVKREFFLKWKSD